MPGNYRHSHIYLFKSSTLMVYHTPENTYIPSPTVLLFGCFFGGMGIRAVPWRRFLILKKSQGEPEELPWGNISLKHPSSFRKRSRFVGVTKWPQIIERLLPLLNIYNFILPLEIDGTVVPLYSHPFGTRKEGCSCKNEIRLRMSTVHFITFSATTGE